MNSWRPYPLLRLVFPFIAGIIAEISVGVMGVPYWIPLVLMAVLLLVSQLLPFMMNRYRFRWITGLFFNLFLLLAGYEIAGSHRPSNNPDYFGKSPDGFFIATFAEPPVAGTQVIKALLQVKFHHENGRWKRTSGQAIGYLKIKKTAPPLQYGDYVLIRAGFTPISDNSNPHVFNYARYLKNKGIEHRVFAETYGWKLISFNPSGLFRQMAFQVRDRLLNILRDNHVEGKEFAVAAALLLGYVDDLDAELRNDYASTGAMHILSVSGMHVGIIYLFLEFLLGFLNKNKTGRFLKAVLLLVFIWFYAMVTGLSPCVLRSAAMLSLPILGKSLNRSPNMFNIIAASLLLILAMDPLLILDVGFQLSYLAVTGIIILYKPIYDWYVTSSWLPDKIWSILAVSIAAQVATLPITLFTFHQFPNYFMLTNIFVVPLSSFIIYVGILTLAVGYIPFLSLVCAKMLILLIWILNTVIHFIEQLPCSTIRGIFISSPEMLLLYLVIGSGFLFLTIRRISWLYLFLGTAIVLQLFFLEFKINRLNSSRLVIFNARRELLCMFSSQDKSVLLYNGNNPFGGTLPANNREMVKAYMDALGISHHREFWLPAANRPAEIAPSFIPVMVSGNFIQFSGCRMAFLNSSIPKGLKKRLDVGLLIITGNPKIKIADVKTCFNPGHIIIDATNSRFKTMQWLKEAAALGVKCHAVTEHGAFQKDF